MVVKSENTDTSHLEGRLGGGVGERMNGLSKISLSLLFSLPSRDKGGVVG